MSQKISNFDGLCIRQSNRSDIPEAVSLLTGARIFMRKSGNHSQWVDGYPSAEDLEKDIRDGNLYVIENILTKKLEMVFAFVQGPDPFYGSIDGKWLDDKLPYGTIHRMASSGRLPRLAQIAFAFCSAICSNLRVDTHADNAPMLRAISLFGFKRCGIVKMADGSPRIAFQKLY